MAFTRKNLKEDLEDLGSNFDGAPGLEFRHAGAAIGLEQSGLSYQRRLDDEILDVEGQRDWWAD